MRYRIVLTIVTVVDDPVFVIKPLVRTQDCYLDPGLQVRQFICPINHATAGHGIQQPPQFT